MTDTPAFLEAADATPGDGEHIYLASEDQDVVPNVTNQRFEQTSRIKGISRQLTVFNESYLSIREQRFRAKPTEHWIHLAFLDPKPTKVRRLAWRWLLGALGTASVSAGLFALAWLVKTPLVQQLAWPAAVLTAAGALIACLLFLHRSEEKFVYYSRHGRSGLLELMSTAPSGRQVRRFMEELAKRIDRARQQAWRSKSEYLRDELREHTRLKKEGILPVHEFDKIMARILSHHEEGPAPG